MLLRDSDSSPDKTSSEEYTDDVNVRICSQSYNQNIPFTCRANAWVAIHFIGISR